MQTLLKPIHTAPRGRYILVFGPSGYMATPLRCEVCILDDEAGWVNHSGVLFTESGDNPVYWCDIQPIDVTVPLSQAEWERLYAQQIKLKLVDYRKDLYLGYVKSIKGFNSNE